MQMFQKSGEERRRHLSNVMYAFVAKVPLKGADIPPVGRQGVARQTSYDPPMVPIPFDERIQRKPVRSMRSRSRAVTIHPYTLHLRCPPPSPCGLDYSQASISTQRVVPDLP